MFDMHYDLLTLLLILKDDKEYLNKTVNDINNNLKGITANLYFMSKKEMKEELNIKKINVSKMFKESIQIFNSLKLKPKTIFSIEGCDYIKNIKELEYLNKLGLKAILPVWNNKNKYASGIRTNKGLTKKGKKLIKKAIDLGLAIDLSHANQKTFFDIINLIKNYDKKAICYASHSNIYNIQKDPRNLTDKQLKALKEIDGYLGIVSYPPFISNKNQKQKYLKHIKYAVKIMGIDKVFLSSDNMNFYKELPNKPKYTKNLFEYKNIKKEIKSLLKQEFTKEEIDKIMYKNANNIYKKLHSEKF